MGSAAFWDSFQKVMAHIGGADKGIELIICTGTKCAAGICMYMEQPQQKVHRSHKVVAKDSLLSNPPVLRNEEKK